MRVARILTALVSAAFITALVIGATALEVGSDEAGADEAGPGGPPGAAQDEPGPPLPHPWHRPARLEQVERLSCRGCHEQIAEEWATSAHGLAWVDERYQEAIAKRRRPQSCWGCHIPEPLHLMAALGAKPTPRAEEVEPLHFGVSCRSCHLGADGVILGPWGEEQEAHASALGESFTGTGSNKLCISCHRTNIGPVIGIAKDFEVAGLTGAGETCIRCHMPAVERPVATDDDDLPTRVRPSRSHRILGPSDTEFLASAFGLSARFEAGRTVLAIENEAGHRVPGLVGRSFELRAEVLDESGHVLGQETLTIDTTAYLRPDETLELTVPAAGVALRVTAEHFQPESEEGVPFLERTLRPGDAGAGD